MPPTGLATSTMLLTTTTSTVAAATAATMVGLSNGDTNGNNQTPSSDSLILGHPVLMTDGVPCLSLPTSRSNSQKTKVRDFSFFLSFQICTSSIPFDIFQLLLVKRRPLALCTVD